MAESLGETIPHPLPVPDKRPIIPQSKKDLVSLTELASRAQEIRSRQRLPIIEQNPSMSHGKEYSAHQADQVDKQNEIQQPIIASDTREQPAKRAWWKELISKPIPTPKFILNAIIDDYHKAFPYVFNENPVKPDIQYEHSLYFPPFETLLSKPDPESFSYKYPLFNEFITQEVSELAAGKRPLFGGLFRLAAMVIGSGSYRLIYHSSYRRWQTVQRALHRSFGKEERKRLVHRAYFLEGKELAALEEKAKEAGTPLDEAYKPIKQNKTNIANEVFWEKIPGKWKDVVLRVLAGAVAYTGKVTDVMLLTSMTVINGMHSLLAQSFLDADCRYFRPSPEVSSLGRSV